MNLLSIIRNLPGLIKLAKNILNNDALLFVLIIVGILFLNLPSESSLYFIKESYGFWIFTTIIFSGCRIPINQLTTFISRLFTNYQERKHKKGTLLPLAFTNLVATITHWTELFWIRTSLNILVASIVMLFITTRFNTINLTDQHNSWFWLFIFTCSLHLCLSFYNFNKANIFELLKLRKNKRYEKKVLSTLNHLEYDERAYLGECIRRNNPYYVDNNSPISARLINKGLLVHIPEQKSMRGSKIGIPTFVWNEITQNRKNEFISASKET